MTKRQLTKQAMIQVLVAEELAAWNMLMFDQWYYGEASCEARASRSVWSVLNSTLYQIGISQYEGPKRRGPIRIAKTV
jgi:hypothetical protein